MTLTSRQRKGKNPMKFVGLLASVSFVFQIAIANAGGCRVIEYAELKDMSDGDLAVTYCSSAGWATAQYENYQRWMNFMLQYGRDRLTVQWAEEARLEWETCKDLLAKITTVRTKRGLLGSPLCEGPSANK